MMAKTRAGIFGGDDAEILDVASFAPKTKTDDKAPRAEQVRAVSQAADFQSREPTSAKPAPKETKRKPRRYRTGRNVQALVEVLIYAHRLSAVIPHNERHPTGSGPRLMLPC